MSSATTPEACQHVATLNPQQLQDWLQQQGMDEQAKHLKSLSGAIIVNKVTSNPAWLVKTQGMPVPVAESFVAALGLDTAPLNKLSKKAASSSSSSSSSKKSSRSSMLSLSSVASAVRQSVTGQDSDSGGSSEDDDDDDDEDASSSDGSSSGSDSEGKKKTKSKKKKESATSAALKSGLKKSVPFSKYGIAVYEDITERIDRVRDSIKKSLNKFTKDFLILYRSALVNELLRQSAADNAALEGAPTDKVQRQLEQVPASALSKRPLHMETLVKRGNVRHSWKERLFVVRPDHVIAYYASADNYAAGAKPKGTINLCGYDIVRDPNKRKIEVREQHARLFGGDPPDDYTKYEPLTIECYHRVKRRWLIKCKDEEQFERWLDILTTCSRFVSTRSLRDPVECAAFDNASRNLANRLNEFRIYGSEIDILTDTLANYYWRTKIGDGLFSKLPGGPGIKAKAAARGFNSVYALTKSVVTSTWRSNISSIDHANKNLKSTFHTELGTARSVKKELVAKASKITEPKVGEMRTTVIVPLANAVAAYLLPKTQGALRSSEVILDTETAAYCKQIAGGADASACTLVNVTRDLNKTAPLMRAFKDMEAGLSDTGMASQVPADTREVAGNVLEVIRALQLSDMVLNMREKTLANLANAAYTFETRFKQAGQAQELHSSLLAQVKQEYMHDAQLDAEDVVAAFIVELLSALLVQRLNTQCKDDVVVLSDIVPENLREYLNPVTVFEEGIHEEFKTAAASAVAAARAH
ncbi:hypothetical protein PTSG_00094 [Salpingoeca rosetta]|uniref:PH domain-containing protein n=1 Tax=Salpingoeca rosetta (strain ATCC 50818 / BSB-021) TaxID=946362 RepID=F2TVI1_SALR5|nr:uncharacterized protein PTSG_00094 [Salpingoeca rosetta]EGD72077.1 hypothetical protein PTSG_00094 [Salpingoeca rosetta]|eukprot:XP_004998649.1 hypothetical protein PTSG_00094 [Salpingoeca rosetta]